MPERARSNTGAPKICSSCAMLLDTDGCEILSALAPPLIDPARHTARNVRSDRGSITLWPLSDNQANLRRFDHLFDGHADTIIGYDRIDLIQTAYDIARSIIEFAGINQYYDFICPFD